MTVVIIVVRIVIQIFLDELMSHIVPFALYGTKNLELVPDIIIKKMGKVLLISSFASGPLEALIR